MRCALKPIARRRETTVAAIALAWTRTWPCVTGAIVGAVTPEQINGWIGACRVELTSSDLDERRGYGRMRCLVRQIEKKVSWLKLGPESTSRNKEMLVRGSGLEDVPVDRGHGQ